MTDMHREIRLLASDSTTVFFYSLMNDQNCIDNNIDAVLYTGGA